MRESFTDDEGDTISYTLVNSTFHFLSLDETTSNFAVTPNTDDETNSPIIIIFKVKDNHYPETNYSVNYEQQVNVLPNTPPTNTSTIADQSFTVGDAYSMTFSDTLFTDLHDTIDNYTFESTPDASNLIKLNETTRTFVKQNGIKNSDAGNYTITLYAHDSNPNSGHGSTTFNIEILPNQPPSLDRGLYTPVTNVSVHHDFEYRIPNDAFSDPENDGIYINVTLDPDDFVLKYTGGNKKLTASPNDNTKFGVYNATLSVGDTYTKNVFTVNLIFEVYQNLPPSIDAPIVDQPCQPAHSLFSYSVEKALMNEPNNETWTLSYNLTGPSDKLGWFGSSDNATHITYYGTPNNTEYANFTVTLTLDDGNSDVANDTATFNI